ncbi:SGNH/GDSL hydrolase family protein [Veronia pacifica]|uniref:Lipolytic enzyme n=1 Tax=Veronia pacifica TaxID=1080227 RepID=A0A1C3EE86_9GAMM|nr:SGNH/GDSL hydrolase family protein [Veronia pacifica]ODA31556.1 lipolytic enzyme [Veronia pacifica]
MVRKLGLLACLLYSSYGITQTVPATHYAVNYEGRSVKEYATGSVLFNFPGSTMKTQFTGTHLSVNLIGRGNHFDVLIDGQLTDKIVTANGPDIQTFELFSSEETATVEVSLVKRTENPDAMVKVVSLDHDGFLQGLWENKPHILFIGDSISAGFGSESNKRDCTWNEIYETSNARLAFPYQTGEILNTSITQVSVSGLGLIRNWSGNQPYHDLSYYADKAGAVFGGKYQFSYEDKHPDLIVIEVGTNDFSTDPQPHEPWNNIGEVREEWVERMVEFTEQLKSRYDNTNIVYMPRPAYPYDYIIPATQEAMATLHSKGVEGLFSHTFVSPLEGCIWHPTATESRDIATKLSAFIQQNELL